MKHAMDSMPGKYLRHRRAVSYIGLNRLEIGMPFLVPVNVDIDYAVAVIEQAPLQDRPEKPGSASNNVSLHSS